MKEMVTRLKIFPVLVHISVRDYKGPRE